MKSASIIGLLVGVAILIWLVAWRGVGEIADLLVRSGWSLLLVPLIWAPTLLMTTTSWQCLFAPGQVPSFRNAFLAQWMGRAVNTLLPVATIGGEIVKARLVILWGADAKETIAATLVDKTVQVVTTIIWGLIGVAILAWTSLDDTLVIWGLVGMFILTAGTAGFIAVQRAGMFGLTTRVAHKLTDWDRLGGMTATAGAIDACITQVYRRYGRLVAATAWRLSALILQSGEVWLAAMLLGHPITIVEALLIKSLTSTLSDVAFVIPNSYGVQEGAFIVMGGLVGWPPDVGLAVSLVLRIRELVIDVPGLLWWQQTEGRAFFRRRQGPTHDTKAN
jgi:putative membrane protein